MPSKTTQPDPIVSKIEQFISKYVVMPKPELRIVAVWILHTWQFSERCPQPSVTPYLYIHSAQKGSGKSLLGIDILDVLVRNPIQAGSITTSSLFRLIESVRPTMLVDEVDTVWSGSRNEELRGMLNVGYRRGAKVYRTQGTDVQEFSPFAPKALIGIDNAMLPDTIRDRCIPIKMRRANDDERKTVQPFYHYEIEDEVADLADQLHEWAYEHGTMVRDYRPTEIPGLSPRQWEISRALVQVAKAANCEQSVRDALAGIFNDVVERATPEQDMLTMIRDLFDMQSGPHAGKLSTQEILAHLATDPRFAGMTGKGLGVKLGAFDIKGGNIRRGNQVDRGYQRSAFADAWERYL
jgi:hypothetical protein